MKGAEEPRWVCPGCGGELEQIPPARLRCRAEDLVFEQEEGIWRLIPAARRDHFARFVQEYETVRTGEGRGMEGAEFYRQLPERDLSGRYRHEWRIRAVSFRALLREVVEPEEAWRGRPLRVLDLGAGNCWLSGRLAGRGHRVVAVDLLTNPRDGLGAFVHYRAAFTPVQADFDHLPLAGSQFDLVVLNASFHYSADYRTTLGEVCRILAPGGQVVILDSPIYRDAKSGLQMVREREARFERRYGFPSNALASQGFLTFGLLEELGRSLGLEWRLWRPCYGWRWALRPWRARLAGDREPASFMLVAGTRTRE